MGEEHWMWKHADKAWHFIGSALCYRILEIYFALWYGSFAANHRAAGTTIFLGLLYEVIYMWLSHWLHGKVWCINIRIWNKTIHLRYEWWREKVCWWDILADFCGMMTEYSRSFYTL
jgi:hypothetical protein